MIIDCDTCTVRGIACEDCVMSVILDRDGSRIDIDAAEQHAIVTLVAAGLVPPLQLQAGRPAELRGTA